MKQLLNINSLILKYSETQKGVFSLGDLKNLIGSKNKSHLYRILTKLSEADIIQQYCRGFYVVKGFDLEVLSQRIAPKSYISFGSVLSKHLIIGSVPNYRVLSVKLGPTRYYDNLSYKIEQHSIKEDLFMGYITKKGVNIASPEKAFLDIVYFYQKGMKLSFDIYSDIDFDAFDKNIVLDLLKHYKNNIFNSLVKKLINV